MNNTSLSISYKHILHLNGKDGGNANSTQERLSPSDDSNLKPSSCEVALPRTAPLIDFSQINNRDKKQRMKRTTEKILL